MPRLDGDVFFFGTAMLAISLKRRRGFTRRTVKTCGKPGL
jgi:hypothetical protein